MSTVEIDSLLSADAPGDAELISAVRDGDTEAYGDLFARHAGAARRLARQLVSSGDADDLVSEAFAKVLVVLQRGAGPDLAFRAYLLTAVRRLHVDRIRATSRLHTTDDLTPFDPGVPFHDTAVAGFESAAAAKAFSSLPERWQMVLWHTEVEEMKPAEVAELLGMSANSVSALAYRAREGLRQAFLSMHAQDADDAACEWAQDGLGAYIRSGTSRRDSAKIESHLGDCRRCMGIYLELTEVNSNLRGLLGPIVLGGAAAAYLKGAGTVGIGAGVAGGWQWLQQFVRQNAAATTAAGVVCAAAVAGGLAMAAGDPTPKPPESAAPADAPAAPPASSGDGGGASPAPAPAVAAPAAAAAGAPLAAPPAQKPGAKPATKPVPKPEPEPAPKPAPKPPPKQPSSDAPASGHNPGHGSTPPGKGGENPGAGDTQGKGKGAGMGGTKGGATAGTKGGGQGKGGGKP